MNTMASTYSLSDYYLFGSPMQGRSFNSSEYRFGFNGHESVDEVYGEKNLYSWGDYGMDTRLGRRWNVDPVFMKYPHQSSYAVNHNSPILYFDPDGKDPREGSTQLTVDFTTSFIIAINDKTPKFGVIDNVLHDRAQDRFAHITSFGPRASGKGLSVAFVISSNLLSKYKMLTGGLLAERLAHDWIKASKSETGYNYVEFKSNNTYSVRRVVNMNESLGVESGFENMVAQRNDIKINADGSETVTRKTFWTYISRTDDQGNTKYYSQENYIDLTGSDNSIKRGEWEEITPE